MNKKVIEVELDGKKVEFAVTKPSHRVAQQGQLHYNRAFREAVSPPDGKPGALVRAKIEAVMREQNLWDDARQARYEAVVKSLLAGEKRLAAGGFRLSEARGVALAMRRDRQELRRLSAERNELDVHSAESQADQARFNYLVSACTVYADTGKFYYQGVDDYLAREDDPVALPAARALGKLLYGLEDDFEKKLPESKFLLKHGFTDGSLRLVDRSGRLVDEEGRWVDGDGRLVNEAGELVDAEGTPLTAEGEYKVEFADFIDDVSDAAAA